MYWLLMILKWIDRDEIEHQFSSWETDDISHIIKNTNKFYTESQFNLS